MADNVQITLDVATEAAEKALKSVKAQTDSATSSFEVFKGSFAAGIAVESLKAAYEKVTEFIGEVIGEASKAEQALQSMNVALKGAGLYSSGASKDFEDFSNQLEKTTIYTAQAGQASIGLFASLTTLQNSGIKKATEAAADLAATLHIDLGQATEMVAKAINGNVTAFQKLGIEIHKGATDTDNLNAVLKALANQQGAAAAASLTYEGATAKLEAQKGKLYEAIGKLITQNPAIIKGMSELTEIFQSMAEFIEENSDTIIDVTKALVASVAVYATASAAVAAYTAFVASGTTALGFLQTAAWGAWAAITGPVGIAIGVIVALGAAIYATVKYWDNIKIAIYDVTAAVLEYAAKAASVFNTNASKTLAAEAQAFRDKAQAVRQSIAQEIAAKEDQKQKEAALSATQDTANAAARARKEQQELAVVYAQRLLDQKFFLTQMSLNEAGYRVSQQTLEAQHEAAMFQISGQYSQAEIEAELAKQMQILEQRQAFEQAELQAQTQNDLAKARLIQDQIAREKAIRDAGQKGALDAQKLGFKQDLERQQQKNKAEETLAHDRIQNQRDTFSTIATLANSNNKVLATIGKAAGIAQIAIDTPVAISKALAAAPPPFNFALAAAVGAAMAVQASQIAGLNFATGGIVPGTSYAGDKVQANVNSREMILNQSQQAQLFRIANGSNSSGNNTTHALLAELVTAVKAGSSISIDGREIMSVVRNGIQSGRTLAS